MKKVDGIKIACEFARTRGYDPDQYQINAAKEGAHWEIHFYRKTDQTKTRPGDFFTIYVDAESKSVERLAPGK